MQKCGIEKMRERLPRCTYSFSHFPNIPIFSLPYSHILTLHSANNGDLVPIRVSGIRIGLLSACKRLTIPLSYSHIALATSNVSLFCRHPDQTTGRFGSKS